MPLEIGQIVKNRYRVVKHLEQHDYSAIYLTLDLDSQLQRVLKEYPNTPTEAQKIFLVDAQRLESLSHPNLPKVLDHFILQEGGQYLVMEYIEGENLQEMLDKQWDP